MKKIVMVTTTIDEKGLLSTLGGLLSTLGGFFQYVQTLMHRATQYMCWWEVAGTSWN